MRCCCVLFRSSARIAVGLFVASLLMRSATAELPAAVDAIFTKQCYKCHGERKKSGKLDLQTVESMLAGGKRGAALVPGDVSSSRVLQVVRPGSKPHMPPGKKQLTPEEIATLEDWIRNLQPLQQSPADEPNASNGETEDQDSPTADREETEQPAETQLAKDQSDSDRPKPSRIPLPIAAEASTVIDLMVDAGYRDQEIRPADLCNDSTFIRRLYLDLLGRIPNLDEAQTFLRSTDSRKRDQLVDQLLASNEFPKHWATLFDAMLMGRNEGRLSDRRKHGWHSYLSEVFEQDRPWNEVAQEVLLARGNDRADAKNRGHLWFLYERKNKHQDIAESIARSFFGVDIACAQCHDHPMAGEIEQAHYWGLVAFFKRSKNSKSENGIAVAESAIGGFDSYANALSGSSDESVLTFLNRAPVSEQRPADPDKQEDKDTLYQQVKHEPRVPKFSRREKFVTEILHDHPLLARSMVNRLWAIMLGRGIVHPLDQMDSQHPASHPELLQWLASDFAANGYHMRPLIAAIAKSKPYQLDTIAPGIEASTFAGGLEKPLTAEAFVRSLETVLQVEPGKENATSVGAEFRKLFPDIVPETQLTTLNQTMMLSNHTELQELFRQTASTFVDRIKSASDNNEWIHGLFQRVFTRPADESEVREIEDYLSSRSDRLENAVADLLWAMTTSAEFRFNH